MKDREKNLDVFFYFGTETEILFLFLTGLVAKQGEQKVGQQNGYASSQSPTSSTIPPQKSPSIANHAPSQLISEQKSSLTVQEIVKSIERMSVSETVKKIPEQLDKIKSPENFETFVTLICEKSLEDPDYAKTSAVLLNELWNHSELNSLIKKPLLTHVQQRYTKRGELKKVKFYGLCVLVCELFRLLRIKDRPLSPLIAAVCQLLKELMKDGEKSTGEDVLYFYQEVESIGDILEKSNEVRMINSFLNRKCGKHLRRSITFEEYTGHFPLS